MRDVVERERDGGERLATSRGDGKREDATVGRRFCFAGSENFSTNIHDCLRGVLRACRNDALGDGDPQRL